MGGSSAATITIRYDKSNLVAPSAGENNFDPRWSEIEALYNFLKDKATKLGCPLLENIIIMMALMEAR